MIMSKLFLVSVTKKLDHLTRKSSATVMTAKSMW